MSYDSGRGTFRLLPLLGPDLPAGDRSERESVYRAGNVAVETGGRILSDPSVRESPRFDAACLHDKQAQRRVGLKVQNKEITEQENRSNQMSGRAVRK
jgi:hypothetical protein